ncbi:TetR/AcrR family transcriptional regulator [Streptoalloteichus hindustanus]|uniref:Transcriptional regulator, TetR family n=1 Tax=Streptoalloteichus hindustanus TaxID=2017 RepID=A0A1M5BIF9_STRHI|nr:TetR family transcriptional regulator C-terminal domain-containing protein [Streptoalloteichus hindustanus]SHF42413.1 transcriptional regulator, TetR family [Streptoalloteichus hindustanus]
MPKVVDHDERRKELAEAVWRIVLRDGVEHASVRTVATEAGWSTGSLRHYFPTQDALVTFAAELAADKVVARIQQRVDVKHGPRRVMRAIALELLPLDEQRRAEIAVWLSFVDRSRVDASLREVERRINGEAVEGYERIFDWAGKVGVLRPGLDPKRESRALQGLVDGLAVHALLRPDQYDNDVLVAVLDDYLDRVFTEQDPAAPAATGTH